MRGTQISLSPLIKEDSRAYFNWINDRELVLKNSSYKPISEVEHERWFNTVTLDPNQVIFSIRQNGNNQLIGSCSLRNINFIHRNAELQIRIGEVSFQNKGYGCEAIQLLVAYGFNDRNLKRIFLHVFSDNIQAIKAYEKCNFQTEGVLRQAAFINGQFVDIVVMSVIN